MGILKAILAHLYIAWIHPFGDGNGRTARLVEFKILLASSIPTPAAHLLSNHYNLTRTEYYRQLESTSKSGGNIIPFLYYALIGFIDGLKLQIKEITNQHLSIAWQAHIYKEFEEHKGSSANIRRRQLVLDLTEKDEPIPLPKISELSPRIASQYAGKSPKAISRDINALLQMKLIVKTSTGYKANKAIMLDLIPVRMLDNN